MLILYGVFRSFTGAVKVTPAHSHADFEMSRRHSLPLVHVIDDDGRLINVPQTFMVICHVIICVSCDGSCHV